MAERRSYSRKISDEDREILLEHSRLLDSKQIFFWDKSDTYNSPYVDNVHITKCFSCKKLALWLNKNVTWPEIDTEHFPSEDMPSSVKSDFLEAATIVKKSPRAAAALLRLAIEKLCNEINGKEMRVFDAIGELVKNGLDPKIQKALDIVRVTGNDAVHPGQINPSDNKADADRLFQLVNLIVDNLITMPRDIDEMYSGISKAKRSAIEKRDS